MGTESCQRPGQGSRSSQYWMKTSRRVYMVRWAADKMASNIEARSFVARNVVKDLKSSSTKRKAKNGRSKNGSSATQEG